MRVEQMQSDARLHEFCRRWHVRELAAFGSAARDAMHADSDYDFLVAFERDVQHGLLDHARMERELAEILGRPVDLVTRAAIENSDNPIRRQSILTTARTVYDAA